MNNFKVMMNGIIKENPTFVLLLGMCPTLGTTSSAINGMGMGLATMFVLICSNVVISAIKNVIPDMVRIPSFIVVIASFVTLLQMVMQAYVPALYATLGLFIPLIVVNCIVLGRAEAFAAKDVYKRQFVFCTQYQYIRLYTCTLQFFYGVLCRLGFQFTGCREIRYISKVHAQSITSQFPLQLTDTFQIRQ